MELTTKEWCYGNPLLAMCYFARMHKLEVCIRSAHVQSFTLTTLNCAAQPDYLEVMVPWESIRGICYKLDMLSMEFSPKIPIKNKPSNLHKNKPSALQREFYWGRGGYLGTPALSFSPEGTVQADHTAPLEGGRKWESRRKTFENYTQA